MTLFIWTPALRDEVILLWPSRSATEIVEIFAKRHIRVSRNSVIGVAHRAGIKKIVSAERKPRIEGPAKPRKPRLIYSTPYVPYAPKMVCAEIEPIGIGLMALTDATCKWPLLEVAEQSFCGLQTVEGKPYCPGHCARAFMPAKPHEPKHMPRRAA
jgi:GcrA cell cycle regulator